MLDISIHKSAIAHDDRVRHLGSRVREIMDVPNIEQYLEHMNDKQRNRVAVVGEYVSCTSSSGY